MRYHPKPKTTTSNLSSISNKYELLPDSDTSNLSIRIQLKYTEHMTAYLDIIENYVKTFGKKYRITEFHIVYDWSNCDIWLFRTNIPYEQSIK